MPRARGLPQKLHQIGAALLLSAHPVSSPTTDKPQASTTVTVTVSNNLFIETERSSPQKYRPFDAPLLPQFPTVRPRFEKLHLDDLRASLDPLLVDLASQYLGPLWLPASFTLNAFAQICAKVRKWGFPYVSRVRARAKQCALSSTTAPPSRRANPLRHNARALRSNRQNLHELHAQKMS